MNKLIPFAFETQDIVVHIDETGEPWFSLPAICRVTGHSNPSVAAQRIPAVEKRSLSIAYPPFGTRETVFVNEAGMYRLVLTSWLPDAKRFKTWVVKGVLSSIRQTGGYGDPIVAIDLRDPRQMVAAAMQLVEINTELSTALAQSQARVAELAPKAQAYDDMCEADGDYGLQNAGRILKMGPNTFVKWLKNSGFLFNQGGVAVPHSKFHALGLFSIKSRNFGGKMRTKTFITPQGLAHFYRLLNPEADVFALAALPVKGSA